MHLQQALFKAVNEGRVIQLSSTDKAEALRELAEVIGASTHLSKSADFVEAIFAREAKVSTYLGYGVALPHARVDLEGDLVCAVGWSPNGIQYGNADDWSVHLILMYCVPESASRFYLTEMASIAKAVEKDKTIYELAVLPDLESVVAKLNRWLGVSADDRSLVRTQGIIGANLFLLPDITEMIEAGRLNDIQIFLSSQPAPDVAEMVSEVDERYQLLLFRLLPRKLADEVFSLLDPDSQDLLVNNMANEEARQVLSALSPDDRTALFEELPANVTRRLLSLLSEQDRKQSLALLSYPRDSVGRLMTNRYITVRPDWTVEQAIEHIRRTGSDSETLEVVYVADEDGILLGDLRLRSLIVASSSAHVLDLLGEHHVALSSLQDREDAVAVFRKYDHYALPVVDANGVLLGIVTTDDILDVSAEEATEDIHKGAALRPLDAGYLKTSLFTIFRSRIPWLIVLVFINLFSGAGIAYFETLIGAYVALVFFLPLLIDSGGNAGSQSSTLVIRSMALGEMTLHDFAKTFSRELLVSISLGLSMAVAVFFLAWWRAGLRIGMAVSLSMATVVTAGSLTGMALPFVLRKLKMDPAVVSAPLVTSLVDILGVLIYFSIASFFLKVSA